MNPQDPLSALHPLREPAMVGWWPLAPGWWIIITAILLLFSWGIYLYWRHRRRNAYRRAALQKLQLIREQYESNGSRNACLSAVNGLLKSAALIAFARRQIAPASGSQWLQIINRDLPPEHRLQEDYLRALYGKSDEGPAVEQVIHAAQLWIKSHRSQSS